MKEYEKKEAFKIEKLATDKKEYFMITPDIRLIKRNCQGNWDVQILIEGEWRLLYGKNRYLKNEKQALKVLGEALLHRELDKVSRLSGAYLHNVNLVLESFIKKFGLEIEGQLLEVEKVEELQLKKKFTKVRKREDKADELETEK